ncbi:MAG: transposase [Phycisphaerales bacterium]|nr:transposase [Phycisphaerales bacterium]
MVFIESFNGKFRYELLNGEIFYTLTEVKVLIEQWRNNYNTIRLHSSLGYRPPAPQRQNLRNQRRRILSRRLAVLCRGWALRSFPA